MSCVKHFIFALAVLVTGIAAASDVPTVSDLASVQAERIMLSARVERAKAEAALAAYGAVPTSAATGTVPPTLRMVYGSYGVNYGLFIYSTGGTATGKPGDPIPGPYKVKAVTLQGADLVDAHGNVVRVPLTNSAPIEPSKASQNTNGGQSLFPVGPMPMSVPPAGPGA